MIGTFFLALLAGFATIHAEPHVKAGLTMLLPKEFQVGGDDLRIVTLLVLLVGVAIALVPLRADSSLFVAALGAGLGYFGTRLVAFLKDPDAILGAKDAPRDRMPHAPDVPERLDEGRDL